MSCALFAFITCLLSFPCFPAPQLILFKSVLWISRASHALRFTRTISKTSAVSTRSLIVAAIRRRAENCGSVYYFLKLDLSAAMASCRAMMNAAASASSSRQQAVKAPSGAQNRQPGGAMMPMHLENPPCSLAFVYGTLKHGFSNHWLIEDVVGAGHAHYLGVAKTKQRFPLVCGPFQVPFLLNMPNSGLQVEGELYAVDQTALERLDELEGVSKGHYQRSPLVLTGLNSLEEDEEDGCSPSSEILGEAYFAYPTLEQGLSSAPHIVAYTEKETVDYVYRKDRPKNHTFLQHVEHWIEAQGPHSYIFT